MFAIYLRREQPKPIAVAMEDIKAARALVDSGHVEEGLQMFERLLSGAAPIDAEHLLRERSLALAARKRFLPALQDREALLNLTAKPRVADAYFAGEYALEAGLPARAMEHFEAAVRLSLADDDSYYLSESRLLKAHCHVELAQHNKAHEELALVPDDLEVLWLSNEDRISKASVMARL